MMKTNEQAHQFNDVLMLGSWFSTIPNELRVLLLDSATIVHYRAEQPIFSYGDSTHGLYGVIRGGVSIGRHSEHGKEALLTLIEPPNWFGEITLFDRMQRTHNAHAVGETTLILINGEALDQILDAEPRYWQSFGLLLTSKVRILLDHAEDLAFLSTSQRLAKRLVMIAESYGGWKDRSHRVIKIQQEQLAMMLFITRQTTNQILKELARLQLISLAYGAIEINDLEKLRAYAAASGNEIG
jgi:CRP-like cAMP-binding protein